MSVLGTNSCRPGSTPTHPRAGVPPVAQPSLLRVSPGDRGAPCPHLLCLGEALTGTGIQGPQACGSRSQAPCGQPMCSLQPVPRKPPDTSHTRLTLGGQQCKSGQSALSKVPGAGGREVSFPEEHGGSTLRAECSPGSPPPPLFRLGQGPAHPPPKLPSLQVFPDLWACLQCPL